MEHLFFVPLSWLLDGDSEAGVEPSFDLDVVKRVTASDYRENEPCGKYGVVSHVVDSLL